MKVRHGRATVSGGFSAKSDTEASPLHSIASRKGHEMILAFPVLLVAAVGVVCSLLGCVVPFAALSTAAALYCPPRVGAAIVATTWLINQLLGFTVHHYPTTASTFAWGIGIGAAAGAAYAFAYILRANVVAAFLVSFAAFEGVLMLFSIRLGGWEAYALPIVGMLFVVNLLWFVAMYAIGRYGFRLHAAR